MKHIRRSFTYLRSLPVRFEAAVEAVDPHIFLRACDHIMAGVFGAATVVLILVVADGLARYFMGVR